MSTIQISDERRKEWDTALFEARFRVTANGEERVLIIKRIVADFFGIKLSQMDSKQRPEFISLPRQVAMWFAYVEFNREALGLQTIGNIFGGRDHGTVLHAREAVRDRMETSVPFRLKMEAIRTQIRNVLKDCAPIERTK